MDVNLSFKKIHQKFNNKYLKDIPKTIKDEFSCIQLDKKIKPGMEIRITVGSRGIDNLQLIIKSIISEVKKKKGYTFYCNSNGVSWWSYYRRAERYIN